MTTHYTSRQGKETTARGIACVAGVQREEKVEKDDSDERAKRLILTLTILFYGLPSRLRWARNVKRHPPMTYTVGEVKALSKLKDIRGYL